MAGHWCEALTNLRPLRVCLAASATLGNSQGNGIASVAAAAAFYGNQDMYAPASCPPYAATALLAVCPLSLLCPLSHIHHLASAPDYDQGARMLD